MVYHDPKEECALRDELDRIKKDNEYAQRVRRLAAVRERDATAQRIDRIQELLNTAIDAVGKAAAMLDDLR